MALPWMWGTAPGALLALLVAQLLALCTKLHLKEPDFCGPVLGLDGHIEHADKEFHTWVQGVQEGTCLKE